MKRTKVKLPERKENYQPPQREREREIGSLGLYIFPQFFLIYYEQQQKKGT